MESFNKECDIWIPSCRPQLAEESKKLLSPYYAKIYNGTGYNSFSKLMNECIAKSENEIVIISNDKARAKPQHVNKIIDLLNQGFGFVGLYRFGFFGFKKDLIRKIGFFNERFIGGGYEDNDFVTRVKEADIAHYLSEEIPYVQLRTLWHYEMALPHFLNKWDYRPPVTIRRKLPEEKYSYEIGEYKGTSFLKFSDSVFMLYANKDWIPMKVL